ncbi:hypothetical protein Ciccas_004393 [Cichlidogyrus casuarinus]|uniref:Uncharacterized protein n=1 Tax=Cichlidogyrus casuarinus TaxID=1844966 RepID=A0ABD2QBM1_9PLAT
MFDSSDSPENYCMDLHNLICVTLDNMILPMRRLLSSSSMLANILTTEISDAENKTFEYIAQQISVICKANENVANQILRQFPRSETCFQCLGIDEFTIQGLLKIRGIGFLELLDMPDESVANILRHYRDSDSSIVRVLSGIAKIRANMELIEKESSFEDDTRNLISLIHNTMSDQCPKDLEALKQRVISKRQRSSNSDEYHDNSETLTSARSAEKRKQYLGNPKLVNGGLTVPSRAANLDCTPPLSPVNKRLNSYLKIPPSPTVKQRFRMNFSLHRSKSHESNLAAKVKQATQNGVVISGNTQSSEDQMTSPEASKVAEFFSFRESINHILLEQARRASLESRSSNKNHAPQLSSSAEAEDELGILTNESNTTYVRTLTGQMHKFEQQSRIGNLVKGTPCDVCKNRINFKFQLCSFCKFVLSLPVQIHFRTESNSTKVAYKIPTSWPA